MVRPSIVMGLSLSLLPSVLLNGCGDDPPPGQGRQRSRHVAAPAPRFRPRRSAGQVLPARPVASQAPDPLVTPDPFTEDPLARGPSAQSDPLADGGNTLASGPKMPTEHSHWLRGSIFNASVVVRLNGQRLGAFNEPIDKDITMKLHPGVNTVTFDYTPGAAPGTADLALLESEHHPPIPPLATFRAAPAEARPATGARVKTMDTQTKTVTFVAR